MLYLQRLWPLCQALSRQALHQEHQDTTTAHAPDHVITMAIVTDSSPLSTDAAREDSSTGQDPTVDPTAAEAPATIKGTHPTAHPATAPAQATHKPTNACTRTTVTHPRHATFPTGVTLEAGQQTEDNLVQDTLTILPTDCTHGRH